VTFASGAVPPPLAGRAEVVATRGQRRAWSRSAGRCRGLARTLPARTRINPLTYAVAPLRSVVFAAQHMPPAAAAKFSSTVTLFGHTLSGAACVGITRAFAVAFLVLAVTGFGKPD
jgi:hypothetical protein